VNSLKQPLCHAIFLRPCQPRFWLFLEERFLFKTFLVAEKQVFGPQTLIPELGSSFAGTGTVSAYRCLGVSACRRGAEWAGRGRLRANVFVPEGLNDRSLAVYCQGPVHNRSRPGGCGMIWFLGTRSVESQTPNAFGYLTEPTFPESDPPTNSKPMNASPLNGATREAVNEGENPKRR
jgi:hypothetical protein